MLTKSEFKWLLNKNCSILKCYEYKRKSDIRKKVKIFANLELPMLQKSGLFSDSLTVFGKNLTIWSKTDIPINSSNTEKCAQNMVGGKGLATYLSLKEDYTYSKIWSVCTFNCVIS